MPGCALVDFGAIANSSTGGNGLPRPFGTFTGCRAGHGNALWLRLPAGTMPAAWGLAQGLAGHAHMGAAGEGSAAVGSASAGASEAAGLAAARVAAPISAAHGGDRAAACPGSRHQGHQKVRGTRIVARCVSRMYSHAIMRKLCSCLGVDGARLCGPHTKNVAMTSNVRMCQIRTQHNTFPSRRYPERSNAQRSSSQCRLCASFLGNASKAPHHVRTAGRGCAAPRQHSGSNQRVTGPLVASDTPYLQSGLLTVAA